MRLKQYINEKLNLNHKLLYYHSTIDMVESEFEIENGGYYQVNIYSYEPMQLGLDDKGIYDYVWEIEFEWVPDNYEYGTIDPFGVTGKMKGKSFEVFSGVATVVNRFIKEKKPNYFIFSAKESSRIKLYDTMTKLIVQKIPYTVKKIKMPNGGTSYLFRGKGK